MIALVILIISLALNFNTENMNVFDQIYKYKVWGRR